MILNKKSRYYPSTLGIDFCGYHIYETHLLIRKRSKQKIKAIIKKANIDLINGVLDEKQIVRKYNSWKAHTSHANTYKLRQKYKNMFNFPIDGNNLEKLKNKDILKNTGEIMNKI